MSWQILVNKEARKHSKKIQSAGLKAKVDELVQILRTDPFAPYPRFESLENDLKGFYSRRINIQHRLVYTVNEETKTVTIVGMFGHY